jgi:hypothetical protein
MAEQSGDRNHLFGLGHERSEQTSLGRASQIDFHPVTEPLDGPQHSDLRHLTMLRLPRDRQAVCKARQYIWAHDNGHRSQIRRP